MIGTVLIVDGVSTNRIVMKVKLGAAGYRTLTAADAESCLDLARRDRPDLVLLSVDMPGGGGLALLKSLRADPQTARVLIVMLATTDEPAIRLAALRAGADEFLVKPIDDQMLFARLRSLARSQEDLGGMAPGPDGIEVLGMAEAGTSFQHPGHIALVTTRPERALHLRMALQDHCRDRISVLLQDQVFTPQTAGRAEPDVYLIEAGLGGAADGGLKVMSALRSRTETRHAKICILNTDLHPVDPAMAFDLGANDLVEAQLGAEEIALRLGGLIRRKREADRMRATLKDSLRLAMTDPLTGIANRRFGLAQLGTIAEKSLVDGRGFALMVLDLDRFKSVNDRFGHAAGDAVLVEVARRLTACLRATDLIARIGGEEFLICLPQTTLAEAQVVAERLCQDIESVPVALHKGDQLRVTISIGLALSHDAPCPTSASLVAEIFDRADRALLKAKAAGRNQVTISKSAA